MKKRRRKKMYYRKWEGLAQPGTGFCENCGDRVFYCDTYDAEFCPQCNIWITEKCGDPECYFCAERQETPKGALAYYKMKSKKYNKYKETQKQWATRHYKYNQLRKQKIHKARMCQNAEDNS